MKMCVCPTCKGDGFYRIAKADAHPWLNVATAKVICRPVQPSGDTLLDYYRSITAYEYNCLRCRGTGELAWTRGRSLIP
jgi:hypothetical protein